MRRLAMVLAALAAFPAFATGDRYVRTDGGAPYNPPTTTTGCDGTADRSLASAQALFLCTGAGGNTGSCACAYDGAARCAGTTANPAGVGAGETCWVGAGRYTSSNAGIFPAASGTSSSAMISYVCPTDLVDDILTPSTEANRCIITGPNGSGYLADGRGRSYIRVDGFTFQAPSTGSQVEVAPWGVSQSGTVDCDPSGGVTGCSQGVMWDHVKARDQAGSPPFLRWRSQGGGRVAGNTLQNFNIQGPYWGTSETVSGFFFIGYSVANTANQETNTLIKNGYIGGGRNTLTITDTKDLTMDVVKMWGGKNHLTDFCNQTVFSGSTPGCENLTFNNVVFGGPAEFREPAPQFLGKIRNLTIRNSVFTGAYQFPFNSHDCEMTGTLTLRNNVILNLDSGKSTPAAELNAGCTGSGCFAGTCASSVMTYDIDYNAYVFTPETVVTSQFKDSRGKTCTGTPSSPVCNTPGGTFLGGNIAGWRAQTGQDLNSIVLLNKDWDETMSTTGGVAPSRVFGNNAPLWMTPDVANWSGTGLTCTAATCPARRFSTGDLFTANITADSSGLATNPYFFEYGQDGTLRSLSSIDDPTANNSISCTGSAYCNVDWTFTPFIDRDGDGTFDAATSAVYGDKPTGDRWVWIWGRKRDVNADGTTDLTAGQALPPQTYKTWALATGSLLIERGDPLSCGHAALDADSDGTVRCDIGPVEYTGAAPPTNTLHLSVDDLPITETNANFTVSFTVHQSDSSSDGTTSFNWTTTAVGGATGAASCAGTADFINASGTGTFASGGSGPKTTTIGTVTICGDTIWEAIEKFRVTISSATNNGTSLVDIVDATADGIISDNDAAPTFTISNTSAAESAGAQTNTPTLSAAAGQAITLPYSCSTGSATIGTSCSSGVDVACTSGTLTFAVGSTTPAAGITLTYCEDSLVETTETASVQFGLPSPAGLATPLSATITVTDNDSASGSSTLRGATLRGGLLNGGPVGSGTLSLGSVTGVSALFPAGNANCVASTSYPCGLLTVTGCPNVTEDRQIRLYVGNKIGAVASLGTIVLMSGGRSTQLWELGLAPTNATAIATLRAAGYRVIQAVWDPPGWNNDVSSADYATSEKAVSCRTATLYKYINDNYLDASTPLCAITNSAGGEGLAYAMAYYGTYAYVDAVYFGSTPYGTRLDLGCGQTELTGGGTCESTYGLPETVSAGKGLINEAFGDPDSDSDGTSDCEEADTSTPTAQATAAWQASSLAYATSTCPDTGTFYYPNTWVSLRTGSLDSTCTCTPGNCTNAPNHADLYHDELDNTVNGRAGATTCHATQTKLDQSAVSGAGHTIHATAAGVTDWQTWVYTAGAPNKCVIYP